MDKIEFESIARKLIGASIVNVSYFEVDSLEGPPSPRWSEDKRFDSLDYGLDLHLAGSQVVGVIWDSEFLSYGISLKDHSLRKELKACTCWDVSNSSRWTPLLGRRILDVRVWWEDLEDNGLSSEYPQAIVLHYGEAEEVFVSAMKVVSDGVLGAMDHITVVFNKQVFEEIGIDPTGNG